MGRKVVSELPLGDAQLQPVRGGDGVLAGSLWAGGQPVLFLLIRRPGCVLCRAEARRLWSMRAEVEATGCKLVCLLHEFLPSEVKAFTAFWGGDCYLDVNKALYRAVGEGKVRKGSWISFLLRICQLRKQQQEARKTVPEDGNMLAGTQMTMGGMMIVKPGGDVSWRCPEKDFAQYPEKEAILKQCAAAGRLQEPGR